MVQMTLNAEDRILMSETDWLLDVIDRAYRRRSWHGTNLRGSLRGLTTAEASWRPTPARHNIWEIVVHAAYWKYAVWRRLTRQPKGSFPLKGSNWFRRSDPTNANLWREDVVLLDRMHRRLREGIGKLSENDLHRLAPGGSVTTFELVAGIAAHDLYHAGQIQLLKRLHRGQY
jgi:DinB superfamily